MKMWLLTVSAAAALSMGVSASPKDPMPEEKGLTGTWVVTSSQLNKRELGNEQGATFVFAPGKLTMKFPGEAKGYRCEITSIDATKTPKEITLNSLEEKDTVIEGIYELKDGELRLCLAWGTARPKEFAAPKGAGTIRLYVLKPEKK